MLLAECTDAVINCPDENSKVFADKHDLFLSFLTALIV